MKVLLGILLISVFTACVAYHRPTGLSDSSPTIRVADQSYVTGRKHLSQRVEAANRAGVSDNTEFVDRKEYSVLLDPCHSKKSKRLAFVGGGFGYKNRSVTLKEDVTLYIRYRDISNKTKGNQVNPYSIGETIFKFTPQKNTKYKLRYGVVYNIETGKVANHYERLKKDFCNEQNL